MILNSFLDIVRTIRLNDVIDMAIMAFVFYKVLYFLARTGSGRVLRGILLLVVVLLLARALNLYVVNYVFGKTFELGILALLVIFQPEIRSLLEKVGGTSKKDRIFITIKNVLMRKDINNDEAITMYPFDGTN